MDSKISYFILDLYDEAQSCPVAEFASRSLGKLKNLLKFDSAGIASFAASSDGSVNATAAYVYNQPIEKITYRQSNIPTGQLKPNGDITSRDPMIASCWKDRGRARHTSLADMDADEDLKSYNKKFETIQIMTIALKNASYRKASYVSLWRAGSKKTFEEKDAKMGDLLLPHLHKAIEINKKIVDPSNQRSLLFFCSKEGFIHFIDDSIIETLQEEWSEWTPPILPKAFLHDVLYSRKRQYLGRSITATAEISCDLVLIKVWSNPVGNLLTPSELRVALCIAEGMSYKEIALNLGVSPATVRNQLHSVYKKTGLNGKVDLSKALKAEYLAR